MQLFFYLWCKTRVKVRGCTMLEYGSISIESLMHLNLLPAVPVLYTIATRAVDIIGLPLIHRVGILMFAFPVMRSF